eukprot:TRINITY_DN29967_c0_g1_i1.p1 TRINITY_DN29967_c0_g1~~TRINITY_DN29967_c0_g1_i1.p1  ORF type:complete len:774 (+),score=262.05 TRINITY_DN29967_c0_g1_i1:53-2323(+)
MASAASSPPTDSPASGVLTASPDARLHAATVDLPQTAGPSVASSPTCDGGIAGAGGGFSEATFSEPAEAESPVAVERRDVRRRRKGDRATPVSSNAGRTDSLSSQGQPPVTAADVNALQAIVHPNQKTRLPVSRKHINIGWVFTESFDGDVDDESITRLASQNLDTLDENYMVRCYADGAEPDPAHPLLTSPRSVLLVVRCGLCVEDLLKEPRHKTRAQARLEGAPDTVAKIRIAHHEARRQERVNILRQQYAAAKQVVGCAELACLVWQAAQSERDKAERSLTASINASTRYGAAGSADSGSPGRALQQGDGKDLRRMARLLREKALGLQTAPLVYDAAMGLMVGKARCDGQSDSRRLEALAKRVVDMAKHREVSYFSKEQVFQQQQAAREQEKAAAIAVRRNRARAEGDLHRLRAASILRATEMRREAERLQMEGRHSQTEMRLRRRAQEEERLRQAHTADAERRRQQARGQAEAQAATARDRAEARARAADERAAEDRELREQRRAERRQVHVQVLAEKRERAAAVADALQERRREYIEAKREGAERRLREFRAARDAAAEERRFMGAHRELRSQLVREQRERLRQKWVAENLARAEEQSRQQQAAATQRASELLEQREMARLRNEDRRLEKERLEAVQRYCAIARREGQEKKHARLGAQIEQRQAATEQIRLEKQAAVTAHQRALRELRDVEMRDRKERAFLIHNSKWGVPAPPLNITDGNEERADHRSPPRATHVAGSSGINDPPRHAVEG